MSILLSLIAIVAMVKFTLVIQKKIRKEQKSGNLPSDDTYTKYIPVTAKGKKKSKGKKGKKK